MKQKFETVESACVLLPYDNIDTDQIIPARYLKATTRDEKFFGEHLFQDRRFHADGSPVEDFPLNNLLLKDAKILVARENFGSGSSREHAAWALAGYGFRAVVAASFADIHRNNELNSFILPVQVGRGFLNQVFEDLSKDPVAHLRIDLPSQTCTSLLSGASEHFDISPYKKYCLLNALDDIDYLLEHKDIIERYETQNSRSAR